MAHIRWSDDLNTDIREIDDQHKQLVEYVNELYDAIVHNNRKSVGFVLEQLIDYTQFHFSFEEEVMQIHEYEYMIPHKRIHDLFVKRVGHYKERFDSGEDIAVELHQLLKRWLVNHIAHDDQNYAIFIREQRLLEAQQAQKKDRSLVGLLSRLLKK